MYTPARTHARAQETLLMQTRSDVRAQLTCTLNRPVHANLTHWQDKSQNQAM